MQCHEFEERMQALLDERRLPQSDSRLLAHAQSCSECSQLLRGQELLFRSFGRVFSPALPSDFAECVVKQAEMRPLAHRSASYRHIWLWVGAVATMAAAAFLTLTLPRGSEKRERGAVAAPANGRPAPKVAASSKPAAKPNRSAPQLLPTRGQEAPPAVATTDMESFGQYSQAIQSLASQVTPERLDEVQEATPGLRPVRTSFSLAIGTIRRTIPPPRKAAPPRKPSKRDSSWLWAAGDQLA